MPLEYLLRLRYHLIDEREISRAQLARLGAGYATVVRAKRLRKAGVPAVAFERLFDRLEADDVALRRVLLKYINSISGSLFNEEEIEKIVTKREAREMLQEIVGNYERKMIAKGVEHGKLETARRMLVKGASIEFIHDVTGLSKNAIAALR